MEKVNEEPDSLAWGAAAKGSCRKVYGDLSKAPITFGKKIVRANFAEKLALGEMSWEQYEKIINQQKEQDADTKG